MKNTLWICLAAVLLAAPVQAINKCVAPDGRVSYSDSPCPASSRNRAVDPPAYRPPVHRYVPPPVTEQQSTLHVYANTHWRESVIRRQVEIGMPAELARAIRGEPSRINRTRTARGTREQWVYGDVGRRDYVYVDNGTVSAIQD